MEMEVWVGEMRSDEAGSVGGGDAGVGGCECQWVESAVVGGCDGSLVVRSCLPPLTSFPRDRTTI